MNSTANASGLAALSICESLLLSLSEREIVPPSEILALLEDAAEAHRAAAAAAEATEPDLHRAAALVIDRIIKGKNSVRGA